MVKWWWMAQASSEEALVWPLVHVVEPLRDKKCHFLGTTVAVSLSVTRKTSVNTRVFVHSSATVRMENFQTWRDQLKRKDEVKLRLTGVSSKDARTKN